MRKRNFFANFGAILAFAFAGTLISTAVIAGVTLGFAKLAGINVTLRDTFYFGAM